MKRTREGYPYQQVKYHGQFGDVDGICEFHYYSKRRLIQKGWRIDESGENTRCIIDIDKNVGTDEYYYHIQFEDLNEGGELLGAESGVGNFERMRKLIEMAITIGIEQEVFDGDYNPSWYEDVLKEFAHHD